MNLLQTVATSPLVDRIGHGLVHFLWQGLLIAAVLALLLRALRGRPAARHAAAWFALATMTAAVPLTAWLAPVPAVEPATISGASSSIERGSRLPAASAEVDPPSQRLPSSTVSITPDGASAERSSLPRQVPSSVAFPFRSAQARLVDASVGALAIGPWMPWVVGIWSAGAVIFGLWRLVGWLAVGRLCRRGVRPASAELQGAARPAD